LRQSAAEWRSHTALLAVLATGTVLGFRPEGGIAGVVLALLYAFLFSYCISWIFALIGKLTKRPEKSV